ncbi:MAG: type II toxin-antitoxin system PrlF family antitoxin [Candidatus Omnitrophica bacterium]|nr:type II toxin-antitoxin system PrlF family antitoxin [Candidatus Omnitrophota bacterium]MBU0897123.1 type II toxin-antitoxin system PrlF family antitoxin [Candidatus Omnitrophota bacterium]MBU1134321.1 type II toxin-antitoxin system PrlF family antitoxin [Candidatus Omnitrophota bacterium]MBU1367640.1 type II toxin-antitoxin system PrlF family antitoxin [Candidatus Omnitrophota bacterium]MBU1523417.1 type II toxin-antitoxin system PrlF family antitoxin [Candidatus Omnitrophota bacterium]
MHFSTVTAKGQTTIPKEVRELLHLSPNDKVVYVPDGKRVFLTPINGNILDLKGVVKHSGKKPIDFSKLREKVKEKVVKEIMKEMR